MKIVWWVIGISVLAVMGLVLGITSFKNGETAIKPENYCNADSDCVPDTCCHAKGCVTSNMAPNCRGIMCTLNCEPETLDCGGSCKCVDNRCSAELAG